MADVIRRAALRLTGAQQQHRLAASERLNLRLFIDTQGQRPVRRIEIQANNVADLSTNSGALEA
jgi:hypothetical protein